MMNKYALIPIELYNPDSLTVKYPINSERGNFQLLEYTTEPDPTDEGWIIFTGEGANVKCAEYLNE